MCVCVCVCVCVQQILHEHRALATHFYVTLFCTSVLSGFQDSPLDLASFKTLRRRVLAGLFLLEHNYEFYFKSPGIEPGSLRSNASALPPQVLQGLGTVTTFDNNCRL
jgi:hypothetical protein